MQNGKCQRRDVPSKRGRISKQRLDSHTHQFRFLPFENTGDIKEARPRIHFSVANGYIKLYHNFHRLYQVELIHYELERGLKFPDIFFNSTRVVKSEVKTLNLENKHTVYKKTFAKNSKAYRNPPEVIVRKAVEKIGERRWSLFGRWSSDFVKECVLVDRETYYSRGERFARRFYSSIFDLLYQDIMGVGTCSSFDFINTC